MDRFKENRDFMKSRFGTALLTDQAKELPQPALQKPYVDDAETIELPKVDKTTAIKNDVYECIIDRRSHREFKKEAMTLDELSFLLWTTQGVKEIRGNNYASIRPVPSAGARHAFETYLAIENVEGLKKGLYRYLALEHKLLLLYEDENLYEKISKGTGDQRFAGTAAVNFIWSCLPYRSEWRYADRSHKVMLLDAGHVCHALYLGCEAIGFGTCAIAAYDQKFMDDLIRVDGNDEFVLYMSPVGKV